MLVLKTQLPFHGSATYRIFIIPLTLATYDVYSVRGQAVEYATNMFPPRCSREVLVSTFHNASLPPNHVRDYIYVVNPVRCFFVYLLKYLLPIQGTLDPRTPPSMSELLTANKIHQISHMEILQEGTRPEPRLCRLLGHISAYDNVEQWRRDNQQKIFLAETARYQQAQIVRLAKPTCQATASGSESPLKLRTLAQFQAAVRSQVEVDKETTVSTEEVLSDSDSEEDEDETESDDDSDNESTWSDETWYDEDPIIEFIKEGTRSLLQHDAKDKMVFYRETSERTLNGAEIQKPWPL
jgi:hypothetical protein